VFAAAGLSNMLSELMQHQQHDAAHAVRPARPANEEVVLTLLNLVRHNDQPSRGYLRLLTSAGVNRSRCAGAAEPVLPEYNDIRSLHSHFSFDFACATQASIAAAAPALLNLCYLSATPGFSAASPLGVTVTGAHLPATSALLARQPMFLNDAMSGISTESLLRVGTRLLKICT